jgi:mRNA-degrading endonuclease RelE of RelBE toxin-antitoxin system
LIVIWDVEVRPAARKQLTQLASAAKLEATHLLRLLRESPIELADTVLKGHKDLYAARFYRGRYRMLYRISPKQRRVIVLRVRLRETAYEGLEPYWFD